MRREPPDAVAGERARIAGELHQLVSEALASMVGQATTAEQLARSRPGDAEVALAAVEETGREALGEIRRLLGATAPRGRGARAVAAAVARRTSWTSSRGCARRGCRSSSMWRGEHHPPLPAGVDLTAYRLVQEALAAALQAPGARCAAVRLRYADGELALDVTDVGEAPSDHERPLLGMRERVALYGGELVAEPFDGVGYAVRARLPVERAA